MYPIQYPQYKLLEGLLGDLYAQEINAKSIYPTYPEKASAAQLESSRFQNLQPKFAKIKEKLTKDLENLKTSIAGYEEAFKEIRKTVDTLPIWIKTLVAVSSIAILGLVISVPFLARSAFDLFSSEDSSFIENVLVTCAVTSIPVIMASLEIGVVLSIPFCIASGHKKEKQSQYDTTLHTIKSSCLYGEKIQRQIKMLDDPAALFKYLEAARPACKAQRQQSIQYGLQTLRQSQHCYSYSYNQQEDTLSTAQQKVDQLQATLNNLKKLEAEPTDEELLNYVFPMPIEPAPVR